MMRGDYVQDVDGVCFTNLQGRKSPVTVRFRNE